MLFEGIVSFQTLLGTIALTFFIYYLLLKKYAKQNENDDDSIDHLTEEFYTFNKRGKRRSTGFEIDKMMPYNRSYSDIRRSIDATSNLNNRSYKQYKKLPKEIVFLIDNVKVFGHFEESILLNLFPHMETKTLLAGEHLYDNCDPNSNIIVIQSGKIEVFVILDKNHVHRIKVAEQGDAIYSLLNILERFGSNSFDSRNYYLSIVAAEDTVLLSIPIAKLKWTLDKHPDALINVVKLIGLRLQKVTLFTLRTYFGLTSNSLIESQSFSPARRHYDTSLDAYKVCYVDSWDSDSKEVTCERCQSKVSACSDMCSECFVRASVLIFKDLLNLDDETTKHIRQESLQPGEELGRQGQVFDTLYFLIDGHISMKEKASNSDSEVHINDLHAGALFGSLSILTGEASLFTFTSTTHCTLLAISREHFFQCVENKPNVIVRLGMLILKDLKLFVRQVDFGLDWSHLEATESLYKQGDVSDSAFVVLTGRLQSSVLHSTKSMLTGEFGRGEIVGLPETLTQVSRGSSVLAVRDSELARLSGGLISFIKLCYPESITTLVQLLGHKILKSLPGKTNIFSMLSHLPHATQDRHLGKISTIGVLSISNHIQLSVFTQLLKSALQENDSCLVLNRDKVTEMLNIPSIEATSNFFLTSWLGQQEDQHDIVIYQGDSQMTLWTQKCIRQADCVLIIAAATDQCSVKKLETLLTKVPSKARKYLVLLHHLGVKRPTKTVQWLRLRPWCVGHFHVRCHSSILSHLHTDHNQQPTPDLKRLARILTNKAIGLVLGGGAARGCAHAGVIKAMQEAGIAIDLVGGTSIGSMVSALWAMNTNYDTFHKAVEYLCKARLNNLMFLLWDLTFPLTSFFTGHYFNRAIRDSIGESICIEDLWLPYFCLSTDVTMATQRVHMFGSLWRYVRASMSLAGYLPPLCDPLDGHLLLDGVYTNNLPADVMHHQMTGTKTIFAVDVGRSAFEEYSSFGDHLSGWWVLFSRLFPWCTAVKVPNIIEVQSRVGYVLSERQLQEVKSGNFCHYLRPPIDHVGSLQFAKFDDIFKIGYLYAKEYFAQKSPD